jgi:hypothetical protein
MYANWYSIRNLEDLSSVCTPEDKAYLHSIKYIKASEVAGYDHFCQTHPEKRVRGECYSNYCIA